VSSAAASPVRAPLAAEGARSVNQREGGGWSASQMVSFVCVCSVWVPCVALPSGGGSSLGSSPLCGSPVGGVPLLSCPRSMWHLLA